jgi:hypothetical protein
MHSAGYHNQQQKVEHLIKKTKELIALALGIAAQIVAEIKN